MKKLMLILGLVLLLPVTASAQATFLLTDAFDSFNSDLWTDYSHDGGSSVVNNGYLSLATTGGTHWGRARVESNFHLLGNFDTQIDYSLAAFDAFYSSACLYIWADDGSFGMRVARTFQADGNNYYEANYQTGGNWTGDFFGLTTDMSGRLKIARSGDYLGAYYKSGDSWVLATGTTLPGGSSDNVWVIFETGNNGDAGSAPYVEAHHDNFYADANGFTNIDSKYITANPEPGTFILLGTGLLGLGTIVRMRRKK